MLSNRPRPPVHEASRRWRLEHRDEINELRSAGRTSVSSALGERRERAHQ